MMFYMNCLNRQYEERQRSIYIRDEKLEESESPNRYVFLYVPNPGSRSRWTYSLSLSEGIPNFMRELKVKRVL